MSASLVIRKLDKALTILDRIEKLLEVMADAKEAKAKKEGEEKVRRMPPFNA